MKITRIELCTSKLKIANDNYQTHIKPPGSELNIANLLAHSKRRYILCSLAKHSLKNLEGHDMFCPLVLKKDYTSANQWARQISHKNE